MKPKTMNVFTISMLYIGSLLGAGFASGKEIYTYFGRYAENGRWGIALCTLFFIALGMLLLQYAAWKKTRTYFDLICLENKRLQTVLAWCMSGIFAIVFMAMLAAGGAVFRQQLAIPAPIGGLVVAGVVYAVVLRGVRGVVKTVGHIVPLILILALGISIFLLVKTPPHLEGTVPATIIKPSQPWYVSAFIYLCYNYIGAIPILYTASKQMDSVKKSLLGGALGGLGLGISLFLLFQVLFLDLSASDRYPMPMLYFSGELSSIIQIVYALALILAIFCAAVNSLYAITLQLPSDSKLKPRILAGICVVCYALSLIGFTNVVQYVYPIQGLMGFVIITLLIVGFVKECLYRYLNRHSQR